MLFAIMLVNLFEVGDLLLRGHLQPLGAHQPPSLCTEELSRVPQPREFFERYVKSRIPVVFRGVAKRSGATTRWSPVNLIEHYGDLVVRLESRHEGSDVIPVTEVGVGRDTLRHFADNYKSMNAYVISQVPMAMESDVMIPPCLLCGNIAKSVQEVHMFIVGKGGKTLLHRDPYSNIHCVFNGTKDWILIADAHGKHLYQSTSSDHEFGGYSVVDVDRVDLIRFPQVSRIHYSKVTLNGGDCVFIPGGFWHQVRVNGDYNTAVSIWFTRHFKGSIPDWSNCIDEEYDFTPLSEVDVIWRFSGGNTSLTQGHMDVNIMRFILLRMARENDGVISIRKFCRFLTDSRSNCSHVVDKMMTILNVSTDLFSIGDLEKWTVENLKGLLEVIDPSDPSNQVDYEYSVINPRKIRHFLHQLYSAKVTSKTSFVAKYCKLGGSKIIADQIFNILDRDHNDVVNGSEVLSGSDEVVNKYVTSPQHSSRTEWKWFDFMKMKGAL